MSNSLIHPVAGSNLSLARAQWSYGQLQKEVELRRTGRGHVHCGLVKERQHEPK